MARVVIGVRPRLEKFEQAAIMSLLSSMGAEVYTLGTRRPKGSKCRKCGTFVAESQGTRQTPGLPDLLAFFKRPAGVSGRDCVVIECKSEKGKLSPAQERFRANCQLAGVAHVSGTLDDIIRWLITNHYLKSGKV